MKLKTMISSTALLACMAAPAALAQQQSPVIQPDDSWISISGNAVEVTDDGFTLDYGANTVFVEMDDWGWYDDTGGVLEGDNVTVYGEVDDDLYETAKIEASSVYVENLGTYFYASSADEETASVHDWLPTPVIASGDVTVTGTVTKVNGSEFTIDSGVQEMKVETAFMSYSPTDDDGYQQIEKGDLVSVTGDMEIDTFEQRELAADTVITLLDDQADS